MTEVQCLQKTDALRVSARYSHDSEELKAEAPELANRLKWGLRRLEREHVQKTIDARRGWVYSQIEHVQQGEYLCLS